MVGVRSIKNWQRIPTTRLTSGGELMVSRDNSTLAFSTELINCIIAFATQGKNEHYKIIDGWFLVCNVDKNFLQSLRMPAKVTGDSLLIHKFTYSLFIGLCSVTSDRLLHSIKLIHCGAPQRDVLSDKMVF